MNRLQLTNDQIRVVSHALETLIAQYNTEAEESETGLVPTADQVTAEDLLDWLEERYGHLANKSA